LLALNNAMAIRFFFFLLSLLVLTSKPLWAQFAQIEGSVKSEGDPVSYASIALEGTSVGTISDENGHFRLENLQEGIHTLLITSVGYSDFSQEIELSNGKTVNIAVELQAEVTQMDEFVVSGTMRPMRLSDSPIKIEVISQKQMDLFLPGPSSSVTDNLQLINGVQEVVACGVCYTNSISINGLPGAYTAVLLDGTPMYGNLASVYGLNGLPNMIIERMEVIKGPSSTLYGSEAVAGVINIITKNPENQPLVDIDIMTTTQQEIFGNLSIAPKIGNTSGYIGLNWANSFGFFDANNDFMGDIVNQDQYSLFTKWNISRKSELPLTVSAKYFYEDRRNGVEEFMEGRNYRTLRGNDSIYGESIYTHRFEMLGTYAFSAVLKLDASVSWHDQNSLYGSDSYLANQQVAFGNLIYRPILDRHDLILGLTARWNGYDDNTVATEIESEGETINQPDNQFIPGVFIQDEFTVNDGLSILGGCASTTMSIMARFFLLVLI
jgi:outer membrane receptor for ferrienterochelin and colicins